MGNILDITYYDYFKLLVFFLDSAASPVCPNSDRSTCLQGTMSKAMSKTCPKAITAARTVGYAAATCESCKSCKSLRQFQGGPEDHSCAAHCLHQHSNLHSQPGPLRNRHRLQRRLLQQRAAALRASGSDLQICNFALWELALVLWLQCARLDPSQVTTESRTRGRGPWGKSLPSLVKQWSRCLWVLWKSDGILPIVMPYSNWKERLFSHEVYQVPRDTK